MIRQAEFRDADAVLGLATDFATLFVVDEPSFHASFAGLLSDPTAYLAVAEAEAKVVAYVLGFSHATFFANGRIVWIEEIMVDTAYRRQGIGRSLLGSIEHWAATQGCPLIALATRRAAEFYRTMGYQESATYFRKLL